MTAPHPVSVGDLTDRFPRLRRPVIEGLLRQGETCNLISHTKVGKSWLALSLGLSVATGRTWLDTFGVSEGRVLLIDNELHPETIVSRIRTVANAMMIPPEDYADTVEVLPLRGRLQGWGDLVTTLENASGYYQLVIADAWYRMLPHGLSENDNAQVAGVYNQIDQLAEKLDCCILVVHHASKGVQSDKRVTDVGSGAGALSRAVDTHLVLREHEQDDHVVLEGAVRSFAPIEPMVLRWIFPVWQVAFGMDPTALKRPQNAAQQQKDRDGCRAIVEALKEHGGLSGNKLRTHAGIASKDRTDRLVAMLEADGQITTHRKTIDGNETIVHTLTK